MKMIKHDWYVPRKNNFSVKIRSCGDNVPVFSDTDELDVTSVVKELKLLSSNNLENISSIESVYAEYYPIERESKIEIIGILQDSNRNDLTRISQCKSLLHIRVDRSGSCWQAAGYVLKYEENIACHQSICKLTLQLTGDVVYHFS